VSEQILPPADSQPSPVQSAAAEIQPESDTAAGANVRSPEDVSAGRVFALLPDPATRQSRRPAGLDSETNKHLGQAQLLLRSVRNAEPDSALGMEYERELARELLTRNRLLRRRAEQREAMREEKLLSHIEPILLDIANLPAQPAPEEMHSLKELIRDQQIIAELQLYTSKAGF
jgi:hypothetical protein